MSKAGEDRGQNERSAAPDLLEQAESIAKSQRKISFMHTGMAETSLDSVWIWGIQRRSYKLKGVNNMVKKTEERNDESGQKNDIFKTWVDSCAAVSKTWEDSYINLY